MVAETCIKKKINIVNIPYNDFPAQDLINHFPAQSLHQRNKQLLCF